MLAVQIAEVCAERNTGGWCDAGRNKGRKVRQHDRDFDCTGKKNEQKQKGVQCSARVKQNQHIKAHSVIVFF